MHACYLRFFKLGALWGALLFSFSAISAPWEDPRWIRLLHYNKTLFGYLSEADGEGFFLHAKGKISPKNEYQALLHALNNEDPDELKNAHCRFPARLRFLKSIGETFESSTVSCEKLESFRKRSEAKSISVVFSSYYLGNPSSSFGHTLVRLGKNSLIDLAQDKTATELLDTGINYGAVTGDSGPVVYALGGLSGLFNGTFNAIPYYYKVREYNDYETRDLWSYQLKLTQPEIDLAIDHIWELGHTHFQYFFLSENCSYHMLTILEALRPSINLRQHLPRLYTIPSETLKALDKEGLIDNVTFRPAPSTLFYHQLDLLNNDEKESVNELFKTGSLSKTHPDERRALIYDTTISLVDFKYAKQILKQEAKAQGIKKPLLIARSRIPVRSSDLDFSYKKPSAPHLGHGQKRLAVSALTIDGKGYTDLDWRFAFHDFLDYDIGYPPKTKIEVVKFNFRTDGHTHQLREFSAVDVVNLGKWDAFTKSPAWKVRLGQWQTLNHAQDLSTQGFILGYGYGRELGIFTPYFMGHLEAAYVSESLHKFKLGYGADFGVLADITNHFKFHTIYEWRIKPWDESAWRNEMRYSDINYGAGLYHKAFTRAGDEEVGARVFFYF